MHPPRCLIRTAQVILPIREKSRNTDPVRVHRGSIYSRGFRWTDRGKYVAQRQATEIEKFGHITREMTQISRSDAAGHFSADTGAARYFDYESAVALRNLATAYGTDMPRYLLAPEVPFCSQRYPISENGCSSMHCGTPAAGSTKSCRWPERTTCWTIRSPARRSPRRSWC